MTTINCVVLYYKSGRKAKEYIQKDKARVLVDDSDDISTLHQLLCTNNICFDVDTDCSFCLPSSGGIWVIDMTGVLGPHNLS